jgi:hypothetical protein
MIDGGKGLAPRTAVLRFLVKVVREPAMCFLFGPFTPRRVYTVLGALPSQVAPS